MKKIAQGIVRLRKLILTVAVLLLIPSAIGAIATRINYDILTYLPQDLDSMIGEVALEDDFHLASTGMITVEGLPTNELIAMKKEIEAVPGVTQTFWLSDVIDPNIPTAMLPADVQQFMFGKNDSTMLIVRFDAPSASDETMEAVAQIEKLLRKDCFFGGMSVILQDTKALVNQEMPMYILIAVGASLLVLFLSLESTITPLLFMLGLLFPIAYNFGTNIFLGQISYITEALAAGCHDGLLHLPAAPLSGREGAALFQRGGHVQRHLQDHDLHLRFQPDHNRGLPCTVCHASDAGPRYRPCHGKGRCPRCHLHRSHPALPDPYL